MLEGGETVVVGVSGGADSVACLSMLGELGELRLRLIAAHFNHRLRGEESDRDESFVRTLCGELGLELELGGGDTLGFAKAERLSLEEAARILRYRFLYEVKAKYGAQKIATAHNSDDQAETVLMRLMRGSGAEGLSGIPPVGAGGVIRPLIEISRREIIDYLKSQNLSFTEDSTNTETKFLRNKVRLQLLPELEKYNPSIRRALGKTAKLEAMCWGFVSSEAERNFSSVFSPGPFGSIIGQVEEFSPLHTALKYALLREAIEKIKGNIKRISFDNIEAAAELICGESASGVVEIPGGFVVAKGYNRFMVSEAALLNHSFSHKIEGEGQWEFPEFECEVRIESAPEVTGDPFTGVFDMGALGFPIEVRSYDGAMRFEPLGMKGHKTLKSFFIDCKVPRFLRPLIPIFVSRDEVMWIGGMRVSEKFKYQGGQALTIRLKRPRFDDFLKGSAR